MAKKKNKVTTGIHGEEESFDRDTKTLNKVRKNHKRDELMKKKSPSVQERNKKPAWVISKLNHAEPVKYGDSEIMVPARCRRRMLKVRDRSLLGKLPKGIRVVDIVENRQDKRKRNRK